MSYVNLPPESFSLHVVCIFWELHLACMYLITCSPLDTLIYARTDDGAIDNYEFVICCWCHSFLHTIYLSIILACFMMFDTKYL